MEDELEALLAVYGDISTISSQNDETLLSLNLQPRFSSSVNFVAAQCDITLSSQYPDVPPVVCISQTTGLLDDGKALRRLVSEQLEALYLPGECVLFQLIDALIDYLDDHNSGSCMICFDDLTCGTVTAPNALKTSCLHCFHLSCLCYWVQVSTATQEQSREAQQEREKDDVAYRALLGELRSEENRLSALQQEQLHLQSTLESLQQTFASVRRMEELEASMASSKAQVSTSSGKRVKNKKHSELGACEEVSQCESELAELQKSLGDIDANTLRKKENDLLQKLKIVAANIEKSLRKVEACRDKVNSESSRMEHEKIVAERAPIVFPCPCCRSTLSTNALVEPHQQPHFDACMQQAARDYQAAPGSNECNRVCVSSLSEELKSLVKEIQRKQAQLRSKPK